MKQTDKYDFIRYLEAKRALDDRSLNRTVWRHLVKELDRIPRLRPLKILEVGAGTVTMLERLVEWGICRDLDYTAVEIDSRLLDHAVNRLSKWAVDRGRRIEQSGQNHLLLKGPKQRIELDLLPMDFFDLPRQSKKAWDLVICHAFLDLVSIDDALPIFFSVLQPSGLFYFTLVFDGVTIMRPVLEPGFDQRLEACYHRSMEKKEGHDPPGGHSQTGRMLLETLVAQKVPILAAGSSDWVVCPPYSGDEAYFLHHILHFMEKSLKNCPDLNAGKLKSWLKRRHNQIDGDQLIYIAHQIDVLGQPPG
jgi:SAM-dependent methyltransferase